MPSAVHHIDFFVLGPPYAKPLGEYLKSSSRVACSLGHGIMGGRIERLRYDLSLGNCVRVEQPAECLDLSSTPGLSGLAYSGVGAPRAVDPEISCPRPEDRFKRIRYDDVVDRLPGGKNWLSLQRIFAAVGPSADLERGFILAAKLEGISQGLTPKEIGNLSATTLSFHRSHFLKPALGVSPLVPSLEAGSVDCFERIASAFFPHTKSSGFTMYVPLHRVLRAADMDIEVTLPTVGVYVCPPRRAAGYLPIPLVRRHEQTHAADILFPLRADSDAAILAEAIAYLGEYLGFAERVDFTAGSRDEPYWEEVLRTRVLSGRLSHGFIEVLRPFLPSPADNGVPSVKEYAAAITKWVRFLRATNDSKDLLPALMNCLTSNELAQLMSERYPKLYSNVVSTPINPFTLSGEPRGLVNVAEHYFRHFGPHYQLGPREIRCPWRRVDDAYGSIAPFIPGSQGIGIAGLQMFQSVSGNKFDTCSLGGFYCDVRQNEKRLYEAVVQW